MRELGIVVAVTALMCLVSGIWFSPWETLFYSGIWVTGAGIVLGVPTGIVYHVRLYQALKPRDELPPGWIWSPLRFNKRLQREERSGVMAWCYAGASGFFVICIGLILMGGGVAMALVRGV